MLNDRERRRHRACFEEAMAREIPDVISEIGVEQFNCDPADRKAWTVGPFEKRPDMTFRKTTVWKDPLEIGWRSHSIFNPSLIGHGDRLYMFYRAAPKKETLCSRIGLAIYDPGEGWRDYPDNPVIFPEDGDEVLGCEDPKVYRVGDDLFVMFYNGISDLPPRCGDVRPGEAPAEIACHIRMAVSRDLLHWEKRGTAVPVSVSRYWAKAAVIPRNPHGEAVKIDGSYLMYVSEGCGGRQQVGYSRDMLHWRFEPRSFLDIGRMGRLHEVACAAVDYCDDGDALMLDFYYRQPNGQNGGGQALFSKREPFRQRALHRGASLSWGGLCRYRGKLVFAQGWDAADGTEEMFFYEETENVNRGLS